MVERLLKIKTPLTESPGESLQQFNAWASCSDNNAFLPMTPIRDARNVYGGVHVQCSPCEVFMKENYRHSGSH